MSASSSSTRSSPQTRWPPAGLGLGDWLASGRLDLLGGLVGVELALAIAPTCSAGRSSLVDSLLAERYSNFASIRLMEQAATLDLEQFESSDQQDRLDRARRQVTGRTTLLTQLFGQIQDVAHRRVASRSACWPMRRG